MIVRPAQPNRRSPGGLRLGISDALGLSLSLVLAYALRFESFAWGPDHLTTLVRFLPVALIAKLVVFYRRGLYRRLWRYSGIGEFQRIMSAVALASALLLLLGVVVLPLMGIFDPAVPIAVVVMDATLTVVVVAGPRMARRWRPVFSSRPRHGGTVTVLIAGAGAAGRLLARELQRNPGLGLTPAGFVDDDPAKHGLTVCGLEVLGSADRLVDFRERFQVDQLIIAMPLAAGSVIRETARKAQLAGLEARTVPGMFDVPVGRVEVATPRPIQIENLLRREPVRTDPDRVLSALSERPVLVTGAGGSIGSELCRQISALQPSSLILLGHGENSIFNVAAELTGAHPGLEVVPLIADVRDGERIHRLLAATRPAVVFHAAAHKHVPLMEINVAEAISNNVLGTRNVCEAAIACGAERFVLVSTDKAVRPTNVMGASKRVAEQMVQTLGARHGRAFIAVRFGNVLGSRGSVVPQFLRQIGAGGPVTVTHPEMRRYFMTIPESVQLALQAAALGRGAEVFVLDMGQPVKIIDLATDLIRMSGFEPNVDIPIIFTGVRPGEKLYEELFFGREHAEPTEHPKILRARNTELPAELDEVTTALIDLAGAGGPDDELRRLLQRLVPDYEPDGSANNISDIRAPVEQPAGASRRARYDGDRSGRPA